MSCKIERIVSAEDFVVLLVSGRIQGEHVDTLRESIAREKGRVAIDLTEVRLVDREAVKLLAVSEANGVELRNSPAYIREWVASERDGMNSQQAGPKS
jgi:anti-anti-sigma regulatory factor